jgi:hypothetical protein
MYAWVIFYPQGWRFFSFSDTSPAFQIPDQPLNPKAEEAFPAII